MRAASEARGGRRLLPAVVLLTGCGRGAIAVGIVQTIIEEVQSAARREAIREATGPNGPYPAPRPIS